MRTRKRFQAAAEKMKELRTKLGLTQEEITTRIQTALRAMNSTKQFDQSQYSAYERGARKQWPEDIVEAIAFALETKVAYLIDMEDEFAHHTEEVLNWIKNPESAVKIKEAYIDWIRERN